MTTGPLANLLPSLVDYWAPRFAGYALPLPQVAELIVQGDALIPATPTAPGQWRPLDLDAAGGICYVRRTGPVQLTKPSTSGVPANCGTGRRLVHTVPLRLILLLDAEHLACRSLESNLVALERLLAALEPGAPLSGLGATGNVTPLRGDTDAARIFTAELGFPVALPAHRAVAALDLSAELTADPSCLTLCPTDPET